MPRTHSPHLDHPLASGVAGALLIAFSALLVRLAAVSPVTAAVFRCAYALPPLTVLGWRERRGGWPARREVLLATAAGLCFAVDLVTWHVSIGAVGAGLATVIANVQVVTVPLVAWWALGERPSGRQLAMLPVALGGVVLISGAFGAGAYGDDPALGAISGLATAFAYTGFLLLLRAATPDPARPAAPLGIATAVSAAACLGIGLIPGIAGTPAGALDLAPTWPAHGWLVLLALSCQVLAWLLISASLSQLPAVATSITLTVQPVGSMLLGIALLAEAPSGTQVAGAAAIVAAIVVGGSELAPGPAPVGSAG